MSIGSWGYFQPPFPFSPPSLFCEFSLPFLFLFFSSSSSDFYERNWIDIGERRINRNWTISYTRVFLNNIR